MKKYISSTMLLLLLLRQCQLYAQPVDSSKGLKDYYNLQRVGRPVIAGK